MKTTISIIALILIAGLFSAAFGETMMIVNQSNSVTSISKSQISNIFLGNSTKWSNGSKATPVDQAKTTGPGKAFLAFIVGMSESEYKSFWVEKMLSGQAEPPAVKSSDSEVIQFVKDNPGAVGYIDAANFKPGDGVKALDIDGNSKW